jgi:predicted transcriptional regulator
MGEDKEAKFKNACPESARLLERETDLGKIYAHLGFDKITDKRLQVKADIMKKVLSYCSEWKSGNEKQWTDKLANRTCVLTRKIREDYIDPLVSEGILEKTSEGNIRFLGLPRNEVQ